VRLAGHNDLKSFVVNIATNFTLCCHLISPGASSI
jgi:hypothetical protein